MNLPESLAREIIRVTILRCQYEELGDKPGVFVGFAVGNMSAALERACIAVGSGDVMLMIGANEGLKEFEK